MFVFGSDDRGGDVGDDRADPGPDEFPGEFGNSINDLVEGVPTPATTVPSGWMAFELDHSTAVPSALSAEVLVEAVIGYDRVVAWATARQQELIAEFHRRPDNGVARPTSSAAVREWAGEEIALALTLAPGAGAVRVASSDRLDGVLLPTRELLEAGRISPDRARLIVDMLWAYDDQIAAAVQERVLPRAPGLTWGQLRSMIARAIISVVPDAEQRHRRARRERRVDLHPGEDGTATLSAFLTAAEATASFEWVTQLARGVQPAPGTDGTGTGRGRGSMDRRRADVLVAMLTGRLVTTAATTATDAVTTSGTVFAPAAAAAADDGHTGTDSATAARAGAAPADFTAAYATPAGAAPADAGSTDATRAEPADPDRPGAPVTDATGPDATGRSCAAPGATGPAGPGPAGPGPAGPGHGGSIPAGVYVAPVSAHRPLIHVTMSISTLLGLDEEPAELAGYGPLPAAVARSMAADPSSTWRRLLTDPVTGGLLDYGRTTYRPPAGLAGFVRIRDGTCRHPGCRRPAMACELDHVHPWSEGGGTNEDNLCALCERHHDLKEQHGWQVVLHDDRTVEWITPTGHRYRGRPVEYPISPRPDPAPPDPPPPQAENRFVPGPPDVDDPPPF